MNKVFTILEKTLDTLLLLLCVLILLISGYSLLDNLTLYRGAEDATLQRYRPHLDALGLTYTQYVTMMLLWEHRVLSVKALGSRLYLDSGTLTPVLKSLEAKGLISRARSEQDERVLLAKLTPDGEALRERAADVPERVAACIGLGPEERARLHALLDRLLDSLRD